MSRGVPLLLAVLTALLSCGERPILTAEDQQWRVLEMTEDLPPGRPGETRADYKMIRAFEIPKTQQMEVEWGWRVVEVETLSSGIADLQRLYGVKGPTCPSWTIVLKDADGFEVARDRGYGWPPQQGTGFLSLQNARRVASGTIGHEMGKVGCR